MIAASERREGRSVKMVDNPSPWIRESEGGRETPMFAAIVGRSDREEVACVEGTLCKRGRGGTAGGGRTGLE